MKWHQWLRQEFPDALRRDLVEDLANALSVYRDPAEVRDQLMTHTEQVHLWADVAPELARHADPAGWAQHFAEGWHWIDRAPLEFIHP